MSEKDLMESGKRISEKLTEIRERIGAPKIPFNINKQVISGEQFIKILEGIPSRKPLIINGKFSFAYIKDHLFLDYLSYQEEIRNTSHKCYTGGKRVHFYRCQTLDNMENIGRSERYCNTTYLINNKCEIDLVDKKDALVRLGWCRQCLEILLEDGQLVYISRPERKSIRDLAYVSGDWKEIIDCVKSCYRGHDDSVEKIKNFFLPFMEEHLHEKINRSGLWRQKEIF